jgi:hypothetical protein
MVFETRQRRPSDPVLVQRIHQGADLVHLPRQTRRFLAEIDQLTAPDAILVATLLIGDAFRHGAPPVTLSLAGLADRHCLRIEVTDQNGTTTWAEITVHDTGQTA